MPAPRQTRRRRWSWPPDHPTALTGDRLEDVGVHDERSVDRVRPHPHHHAGPVLADTTSAVGIGGGCSHSSCDREGGGDIESAQGDWAELEEGLYWALIPTGADHDTTAFPDAFDDFLIAYGNVFDRASIGN